MSNLTELLNFWYLLSILAIVLEVIIGFPLVFFFAGLAALITGGLISLSVIASENLTNQVLVFLLLNIVWIPFFWQRFKKTFTASSAQEFSNIIGRNVEVINGFEKGKKTGKVKWSGTTFNAILDETSKAPNKGDMLKVTEIKGNKFIIKKEV